MTVSRRGAAKLVGVTALSYSRILGANDRVNLGVVGTGGRGQYVMTVFQKSKEVQVTAVCDVYGKRIDEALGKAPGAKSFYDHRKLVELKEVDVVLIGTPDHRHKETAIDALNAGKDVYVEKPLTHRREDGPDIVRAARVNNRICQVGMQQRSGRIYLEAKQRFIDTGELGKISHIRCVWHSGRPRRLPVEPAQQPSNLDWARFLGPVKWRDWNPAQYLNFRAFLDFGGGKITDFGAHWLDVVHMYMGVDAPLSVSSAGGVYFDFNDGRTAPDTISVLYEYPGFSVSFESLAVDNAGPYHIEFLGDQGKLWIDRNRYQFQRNEKGALPVEQKIPGDITDDHVRDFLESCVSRKLPKGDVYIGHRSAQTCLLAVQSYQEKRRIRFDGVREEVFGV